MSNYTGIKALINADIRENNNEEITGQILNGVLLQMVTDLGAYQFAGVATPTTNPGTPDINVYYVAGTAGTYGNMGGFSVAAGEFAFLLYNGSWTKLSLPVRYVDASSDQNIGGDKTFTGDVAVYGNLGIVGGLSLGSDFSVDGNIGATGNIIAGGDLVGRELYEYDTELGDYVLLSQKYQALLQSGVNIKTINGISLLGSGNIVIQGGGGGGSAVWGGITGTLADQTDLANALHDKQNVLIPGENITITNGVISASNGIYMCEYGTTTFMDVASAILAGELPVCQYADSTTGRYLILTEVNSSALVFSAVVGHVIYGVQLTNQGVWSVLPTLEKVTSVSSSSTDNQVPTAKCLYDLVGDIEALILALL